MSNKTQSNAKGKIKPGEILECSDAAIRRGALHVTELESVPTLLLPEGFTAKTFEKFLEKPLRVSSKIRVTTADSFSEYYNKYADDDSLIFCNKSAGIIYAVLDYHKVSDPRWCDHIVELKLQCTNEWTTWEKMSGFQFNQIDFGYFLEEHIDDLNRPTGAEMLEIALNLTNTKKVAFKSSQRLSDGQTQLEYVEDNDSNSGVAGQFKVPEDFDIGIGVFEGGEAYKIKCKFRHRIKSGNITMWYDILNVNKIVDTAFNTEVERVKAACKDGTFLFGHH